MIKGIAAAFLAALLVTAIILGLSYVIGIIEWLATVIVVGVVIAAIILFFVIFIFAIVVFFALFYYLAEKKPVIEPGEYKLDEEKGKNE